MSPTGCARAWKWPPGRGAPPSLRRLVSACSCALTWTVWDMGILPGLRLVPHQDRRLTSQPLSPSRHCLAFHAGSQPSAQARPRRLDGPVLDTPRSLQLRDEALILTVWGFSVKTVLWTQPPRRPSSSPAPLPMHAWGPGVRVGRRERTLVPFDHFCSRLSQASGHHEALVPKCHAVPRQALAHMSTPHRHCPSPPPRKAPLGCDTGPAGDRCIAGS